MTLGLCSGYYFYQWAKDLREVQPSFALAYDIVLHPSEITPDKLTHRYHHVILAMVMYATVAFSRQFLQHGSNLVLAFRPGSTSNINNGNLLPLPQQQRQPEKEQDQEQQRKQADQTEAAALVSGSSSWASMFFPSALKHATWMYHYNFYDALISATDMILKRYHAYLPDLWPKAWNSTVGKQTMDQFLIYLDQYRTTETAYETFLATGWVILFPALLGWTLRAFIMDLQNEPRTWWGGRVDPNRWTVVERMTATLVKNRRVQELKRIVGQGFKMMGSWLALNWPKLSLMGLSIRSLVKIDYLRQSIQSLVITTVQQSSKLLRSVFYNDTFF
ncbi:hypothetical protein BGZ83_007259 [Gryganskiella cystojenkinii]|nr:hypothetical protein BGZ83_007259 [Gryganskiella cystojenkinii]